MTALIQMSVLPLKFRKKNIVAAQAKMNPPANAFFRPNRCAIRLKIIIPTRLRSTGVSFCYNVGRFIAATGPFTLGVLQKSLGDKAVAALPMTADAIAKADAKLNAFREAACWLSLVYLVGLLVLPFLPETKDQPLPEDSEGAR